MIPCKCNVSQTTNHKLQCSTKSNYRFSSDNSCITEKITTWHFNLPSGTEQSLNGSWWWYRCVVFYKYIANLWILAQHLQASVSVSQIASTFPVKTVCS